MQNRRTKRRGHSLHTTGHLLPLALGREIFRISEFQNKRI